MKEVSLKVGLRRLVKLAEHLKHGKLGHERFDFAQYNDATGPRCGTAGCAIGEFPIVFPRQWEFCSTGYPMVKGKDSSALSDCRFFGISSGAYEHLFVPHGQSPEIFGGSYLNIRATRKQVARNISIYVKRICKAQGVAL